MTLDDVIGLTVRLSHRPQGADMAEILAAIAITAPMASPCLASAAVARLEADGRIVMLTRGDGRRRAFGSMRGAVDAGWAQDDAQLHTQRRTLTLTAAVIAAEVSRVAALLAQTPTGMRLGAMAEGLGYTRHQAEAVIAEAQRAGRAHRLGEARAARYYPGGVPGGATRDPAESLRAAALALAAGEDGVAAADLADAGLALQTLMRLADAGQVGRAAVPGCPHRSGRYFAPAQRAAQWEAAAAQRHQALAEAKRSALHERGHEVARRLAEERRA